MVARSVTLFISFLTVRAATNLAGDRGVQDRACHQMRSPLGGIPLSSKKLSATATGHTDLNQSPGTPFGLNHVDGQLPRLVPRDRTTGATAR